MSTKAQHINFADWSAKQACQQREKVNTVPISADRSLHVDLALLTI